MTGHQSQFPPGRRDTHFSRPVEQDDRTAAELTEMREPSLAQGSEAHRAVGGLEGDIELIPELAIEVGDVVLGMVDGGDRALVRDQVQRRFSNSRVTTLLPAPGSPRTSRSRPRASGIFDAPNCSRSQKLVHQFYKANPVIFVKSVTVAGQLRW
jgi:hypothetical protein